ncbi:MAG TPA: hypothetical protein VGA85_02640 [Dehalococcoidales bacterium]
MRFLSRLFGQPPKKTEINIHLTGPSTFSTQVVGESYYQENLSKICGGFTEEGVDRITTAKLVHTDDNPHDTNAIRVEISGMPVGHLNRTEAQNYRERMKANGHSGLTATCNAKITGGWDRGSNDIGYFGITLDMPNDLVESLSNGAPITNNLEQTMESDAFLFDVEKSPPEELERCRIGDYVNFWVPKDNTSKVFIFRRRAVGGTGKIGIVPNKYSNVISAHLSKGLECETEIVEIDIDKSICKIKCKLISKEETAARQASEVEAAASRLKDELQKRYKPKQSLLIRVQLPKNHQLKEGQKLYLEKQTLEYYIQNATSLHINLVDKDGIVVAQKNNEPRLISSILRAFFSQYAMTFQISSIEKPDKYTLKYLDQIEAKVTVSFEKDA